MISDDTRPAVFQIHTLWEKLTAELCDILDGHGVCAACAYEIAVYSGVTTVVGLTDEQGGYHDVWICRPDGELTQTRWSGNKTSLSLLTAGGHAGRTEKYHVAPKDVIGNELWLLAHDAILAAPLPFPAASFELVPAGALCLIDPPENCLLDTGSIEYLAMHISTFLDRAFLRRQATQQAVEFGVVYDLASALTGTLDLDSIFGQITDPVRRILNVETVSIALVDPVSAEIVFVDSLMGPEFEHLPPIRLQPGQGIAGWVAKHNEPLIINETRRDQRFFAYVDNTSGFRTQSILCVPLQVEQRVIGVLEAINKQNGKFSDADLRLLQAITGPLAAAIQNAWLHADVLAEKRRVETIFASMAEGMLTVNEAGYITTANDAFLALTRRTAEDLIGRRAEDVILLSNQGGFYSFMERVIRNTEDTPQLATELRRNENTWMPVLVSGAAVSGDDGQISEGIYVFSDLRQIREVERMRDDFFHNIVHELRTPLATILMYARLLREGKADDDPEKADRFLGVIERESDRLQRMVRQMLQVSKLNSREIQRSPGMVNLNDLFAELLPPLADRAVEKGLTFNQRIPADLPVILGHEETLQMVFSNLLDNAIKFTMSGSVAIRATTNAGAVEIVVRDDGIGIPRESMPNLFKRFYRTRLAVERGIAGSGLGLYMVKEGVEKHNGVLLVESEEGKGTMFTVRLPQAHRSFAAREVAGGG